jgi:hypothetical protein
MLDLFRILQPQRPAPIRGARLVCFDTPARIKKVKLNAAYYKKHRARLLAAQTLRDKLRRQAR